MAAKTTKAKKKQARNNLEWTRVKRAAEQYGRKSKAWTADPFTKALRRQHAAKVRELNAENAARVQELESTLRQARSNFNSSFAKQRQDNAKKLTELSCRHANSLIRTLKAEKAQNDRELQKLERQIRDREEQRS